MDNNFFKRMNSKVVIAGDDDCWNWIGSVNNIGRPVITIDKKTKTSREVQTFYPQNLIVKEFYPDCGYFRVVDILCGNLRCCNPKHLSPRTFDNRFWKNVDKPDGDGGCWLWSGTKRPNGYGNITIDGKSWLTHRIAYEEYYQTKIPDNMMVLHSCNNRACINPAHLRLGTHQDNMNDMVDSDHSGKGERNTNAVLEEADVQKIRVFLSKGISMRSIAEAFNVSVSTIKDISRGRTWSWL